MLWNYDTELGSYFFSLQEPLKTYSFKGLQYNKWLHFTISNGADNKFKVFKYGDQVILSKPSMNIKKENNESIFLGSSILPSIGKFEGYILDFRLWKISLTADQARDNFDRLLYSKEYKELILYYRLDEKVGCSVTDSISGLKAISQHPYKWDWTSEDPICCKKINKKCEEKKFDGLICTGISLFQLIHYVDKRKFMYFDGTREIKLPLRLLQPEDKLFISFWIKPELAISNFTNAVVIHMPTVYTIYHYCNKSLIYKDENRSVLLH